MVANMRADFSTVNAQFEYEQPSPMFNTGDTEVTTTVEINPELMNGVYGAQLLAQQPNVLAAHDQASADGLFGAVCDLGEEAIAVGQTLQQAPVVNVEQSNGVQVSTNDTAYVDPKNQQYTHEAQMPEAAPAPSVA